MPVRSLNSPVLRWPDAAEVDRAVREWAGEVGRSRPEAVRIGYFGSYARGDWGVGSDVDLVVLLDRCDEPLIQRAARWDTNRLPVPADVLVYTLEELQRAQDSGFGRKLTSEVVWVYERALSL